MPVVNLGAVWLNDGLDPSDYKSFQNTTGLEVETARDGTVRRLANGRLRLVLGSAAPHTTSLTFELCDRDQIDWLEQHVGRAVCYRDDRGRKYYGVYLEVSVRENVARQDYADANITLAEVTYPEGQ